MVKSPNSTWSPFSKKKFVLSFEEHCKFVHPLNLETQPDWYDYYDKNITPDGIIKFVKEYFVKQGTWPEKNDWDIFLGRNRTRYHKTGTPLEPEILEEFGLESGIESRRVWILAYNAGLFPPGVPKSIEGHLKRLNRWNGWDKFLGEKFLSFKIHREFGRSLGLTSEGEWRDFCEKFELPTGITEWPETKFKRSKEWRGWPDFLDFDASERVVSSTGRKIRQIDKSIEECSVLAQKRGFKTIKDWNDYFEKHPIPEGYPKNLSSLYKNNPDWPGTGEFFGTGFIANTKKPHVTYEEARKFARTLNLKSGDEWYAYWDNHKLPKGIYKSVEPWYKKQGTWKGWGDFLGTGNMSPSEQGKNFYLFSEAKIHYQKIAKENNFSDSKINAKELWKQVRSTITDKRLPRNPNHQYSIKMVKKRLRGTRKLSSLMPGIDYYYDFYDTFGIIDPRYTSHKILELLESWSKDSFLQDVDDDVLFALYETKNLFNIKGKYAKIFEYILTHRQDREFGEYLKKTLKTKNVPSQIEDAQTTLDVDEELSEEYREESFTQPAETSILSEPTYEDTSKVLEQAQRSYETRTNRRLMSKEETNLVDDKESYEFFLRSFVNKIWRNAFLDKKKCLNDLKKSKDYKKKFAKEIKKTFLEEYNAAEKLKVPKDWNTYEPTLMQRHFATKILEKKYYGNFSGTGAGKTLSALLSSRLLNSKMTLIVCPNGVVTQWEEVIRDTFSDFTVIKKEDAFEVKRDNSKFQYLIINYDQFNQGDRTNNRIKKLGSQKIDYVILDEIHFSKTTNYEHKSQRRDFLDKLLSLIREKNPKWKVVGLSATPVVNNLAEGRSLLELITGQEYGDELSDEPTTRNAMRLRQRFVIMSIREEPRYALPIISESNVTATIPLDLQIRNLNTDKLVIEQLCTEKRIKKIIKKLKKNQKNIVYTEFVGGRIEGKPTIIQMLDNEITKAGFKCRRYTGDDHTGKDAFVKDKTVKVLLATKPISTGVDDLQKVCHNMVFNNLPWTHALYTQIVGRLVRKKQKHRVKLHHVIADVEYDGQTFTYDQKRLDAIESKKTTLDCVVSGILPETARVGKDTITKSLRGWIKRIQDGRRMDLIRPYRIYDITAAEIQRRKRKFGDFENINKKIIKSKSDTNFETFKENQEMWYAYHSGLNETKKTWSYDPNEEWIAKIEKIPKSRRIGDFGCGLGIIGREFGRKRVKSFDLHSDDEKLITACNMKSVPLKNNSIDIAIYNLSLMGTDWNEFLQEANRVLAYNGFLWIADTVKHRQGYLKKLPQILENLNFQIVRDEKRGNFFMLEAIKME